MQGRSGRGLCSNNSCQESENGLSCFQPAKLSLPPERRSRHGKIQRPPRERQEIRYKEHGIIHIGRITETESVINLSLHEPYKSPNTSRLMPVVHLLSPFDSQDDLTLANSRMSMIELLTQKRSRSRPKPPTSAFWTHSLHLVEFRAKPVATKVLASSTEPGLPLISSLGTTFAVWFEKPLKNLLVLRVKSAQ